jgi:hypothetical protein
LVVRCIDESGELDQNRGEATIADNMGRGGARLKTTLSLAKGDVVWVAEPGGSFRTRGEIRNVVIGRDGVTRVNMMFLDGLAPERLFSGTPSANG